MYSRTLKWFIPAAVLAVATALVYRSNMAEQSAAPAPVGTLTSVGSDETAANITMLSGHDSNADKRHELITLQEELKKTPAHVPVLLRMAQLARELGKLPESITHLREAVANEPRNSEAHLELGRALFEAGDVEGAIGETKNVLQLDSNNVDGLYNLGAIYGNMGRDDLAREYWEKAIAVSPDSPSGRQAKDGLPLLSSNRQP